MSAQSGICARLCCATIANTAVEQESVQSHSGVKDDKCPPKILLIDIPSGDIIDSYVFPDEAFWRDFCLVYTESYCLVFMQREPF